MFEAGNLFDNASLFYELYRKAPYLDVRFGADKHILLPHNGKEYDVIINAYGGGGNAERYVTIYFTIADLFQVALVYKRTAQERNSGALVISEVKLTEAYIKKTYVPLEEIEHCFVLMKMVVGDRPLT